MKIQLVLVFAFGAMCVGCVTDPYIDVSIAKLDTSPVPVVDRFNLPKFPELPIRPLSANMLVGSWETGIQHPVHRHVGKDGQIHDFDKPGKYFNNVWHSYGFNDDGTYLCMEINGIGTTAISSKKTGKWQYDSGKLVLHEEKNATECSDYAMKALGLANWQQHTVCNTGLTLQYRIEWFSHDKIAIVPDWDSEASAQSTAKHTTVIVDEYGVKTKRSCNVSGMKNGRAVGTVDETISPPMHFRKKEK